MNWKQIIGIILLAGGLLVLTLKLTRVYDVAPTLERFSAKTSPAIAHFVHRVQPDRIVYALLIIIPVCLGAVLLGLSARSKPKTVREIPSATKAPLLPLVKPEKVAGKAAFHSCNVLDVSPQARQLWQFDARNGGFVLSRQQTSLPGEPLP